MADSDAWIPYRTPGEPGPSPEPNRSDAAPADDPPLPAPVAEEPPVEVVDGLPVLAEVRALSPQRVAAIPGVQAAAAAATGFVAGAATMALARRVAVRRLTRMDPRLSGRAGLFPASGTRTFLVHVRVLGRPPE